MNAHFAGDKILRFPYAHVGIAVAAPNGLVVPVIRDADRRTIQEIAAARADVVGRARDGKLQRADLEDGTFTISNLGMFGIEQFIAVLNPPQAAILAVGATEEKPVVRDGQVVVRPLMSMTITCDHRAIDGADGAEFLRTVKELLEEPALALVTWRRSGTACATSTRPAPSTATRSASRRSSSTSTTAGRGCTTARWRSRSRRASRTRPAASPTSTSPDVKSEAERLREAGVEVGVVFELHGQIRLVDVFDPDGNRIQLAQSLDAVSDGARPPARRHAGRPVPPRHAPPRVLLARARPRLARLPLRARVGQARRHGA